MAGRLTRFLNLERPRKARDEPKHEVVTPHRFEPEPELQLEQDHGEQPFLRCPSCEADNTRFAIACVNCRTRLDTDEARAWNDQLWEARRAAAAQEAVASEQVAADRRALGEAIAREVGEREQARWADSTAPGVRLLARAVEALFWTFRRW